jgi:toxin FitB
LYLLDTNILSATAPDKVVVGAEAFAGWLQHRRDHLCLSAVTIAEVEGGIAKAIRIAAHTKARRLADWLAAVEFFYGERILPFGRAEARSAGTLIDRVRSHNPGFADIAIAATAATHQLVVLTANERHFEPLGVPWHNPLRELPTDALSQA